MAFEKLDSAYITSDGTYGGGDIILFNVDDLNDRQWDTLVNLPDSDRIDYVYAIMAGEPVLDFESEN